MTIKKIGLSALAASALTTALFSGTLTTDPRKAATEVLTGQAQSFTFDVNATYVPSFLGSVSAGSLILDFDGLTVNDGNVTDAYVYNATTAKIVAGPGVKGDGTQIILDINGTITTGDTLKFVNKDTVFENNTSSLDLNLTAASGTTAATVGVTFSNASASQIDSTTQTSILTTGAEWSALIATTFDQQIDAAANFLTFRSSATDDNATITVTKSSTITSGMTSGNLSSVLTVNADNNVSAFGTTTIEGATVTIGSDNNFSATKTITATDTLNIDFSAGGSVAIANTEWTTGLTTTYTNNSTNTQTLVTNTTGNLGSFTTYGYTAQIPGASYSAGATDTTISLVNTGSSSTTDAVVTIADATGESCSLTSASDSEVTKPTAGITTKMKLSTMLGNSKCSALTGTSYSIELSVPTTPTNIYSNAFVKNNTIDQFKVLPVYNNGNNY